MNGIPETRILNWFTFGLSKVVRDKVIFFISYFFYSYFSSI